MFASQIDTVMGILAQERLCWQDVKNAMDPMHGYGPQMVAMSCLSNYKFLKDSAPQSWLVGWLVGWWVGRLIGWLVGGLVG
jgi:hypothetical protein